MRAVLLAIGLSFMSFSASAQPSAVWELRTPAGASVPCRAVKSQADFAVQLLRNSSDKMIVSVGGADVGLSPGTRVAVDLSIDGGTPVQLEGFAMGPITLMLINEAEIERSLRTATMTNWRFPWGEFSADVTGLGEAFDAISVCPA